MASMTNAFETDLLEFIFQDTAIPWEAAATNLYVSLHTSSAGEAGDQTTNEAAYTSYARVAVVRSGSGWDVTNDVASNVAAVTFPAATGGSETVTHFGVGTDSTGTGNLVFHAALGSGLAVSSGITPEFAIGVLTITAA
ncbi:MAG: hypothetical protein RL885_25075 [Planctomycetota bacterium]